MQLRQLPSLLFVQSAASLRSPAKLVVAVVEVLGSQTAEVLATQNLVTHGKRAVGFVKRKSPRQRWIISYMLPNPK